MINILEKKSYEEFRQYLDNLSERKLLQKLIQPFTDNFGNEFTALSYLIQTSKIKDMNEKIQCVLEHLSNVERFNLPQYLNSYRVGKNVMKDTPIYLLAVLYQHPSMMESLYGFGINPNVTMLNIEGMPLSADILSEAVSSSENQTVAEKHQEIKSRYLEYKLSNNLKDKPSQKKVKL